MEHANSPALEFFPSSISDALSNSPEWYAIIDAASRPIAEHSPTSPERSTTPTAYLPSSKKPSPSKPSLKTGSRLSVKKTWPRVRFALEDMEYDPPSPRRPVINLGDKCVGMKPKPDHRDISERVLVSRLYIREPGSTPWPHILPGTSNADPSRLPDSKKRNHADMDPETEIQWLSPEHAAKHVGSIIDTFYLADPPTKLPSGDFSDWDLDTPVPSIETEDEPSGSEAMPEVVYHADTERSETLHASYTPYDADIPEDGCTIVAIEDEHSRESSLDHSIATPQCDWYTAAPSHVAGHGWPARCVGV